MADVLPSPGPSLAQGKQNINQKFEQVDQRGDSLQLQITSEEGAREAADEAHASSPTAHPAEHIPYSGAVTGATTTKQAVDNLQTQVNTLVVSGDSSPAAAQAAIDSEGHDYGNLKLRLDTEHGQLTAQLAEDTQETTLFFLQGINRIRTRQIISVQGFYLVEDGFYGKYRVVMVDGSETWTTINNGDFSFKISQDGYIAADKDLTIEDKKLKVIPEHGKVNIKMFGAIDDGITDNHIIIQNIINGTDFSAVLIPDGDFCISSKLITNRNIAIIGNGPNSNLIRTDPVSEFIKVTMADKHNPWLQVHLKDFNMLCAPGVDPTSGFALDIQHSRTITENLYIWNVYDGVALRCIDSIPQPWYSNCRMTNTRVYRFKRYGCYVHNMIDCSFKSMYCIASDVVEDPSSSAIPLFLSYNVQGCNWIDGAFNGGSRNIDFEGDFANGICPSHNVFSGVYFDSSYNGAFVRLCRNIKFDECWFSNRPWYGLTILAVEDVTFTNCSFYRCGRHGVTIVYNILGCRNVKFIACSYISNNQSNVASGDGLYATTGGWIVEGGYFGNNEVDGHQTRGVRVEDSGANVTDGWILKTCIITRNKLADVNCLVDTSTGTHKIIADNLVYDNNYNP